MKFDKLNEMLPFVMGGKEKVLSYQPYNAVTLRFPGRHAKDTDPVGGDFVVCLDDEEMGWVSHQFTHNDLFNDIAVKVSEKYLRHEPLRFMEHYASIVASGKDPEKIDVEQFEGMPGLHPQTFLYGVQCLAVAEHRRYKKFEAKFGGRFLPLRFSAGIAQGLWTAADCASLQRRGRIGVEILEKTHGTPDITKELFISK